MTVKRMTLTAALLSLSGMIALAGNEPVPVKKTETPGTGTPVGSTEKTTVKTVETTTKTVTTTTIVREKVKWSPFRVCVLDFSSLDIEGQKRFLDPNNKPIVIPPQCTLNDADRQSVNGVM